jgi:hypothetical protein
MKPPVKGLALVLSPKSPKASEKDESEPATDEDEEGGSEKEYARLASESSAAGDHDAAADALVSMVKACMGSYGPKK